MPTNSTLVPRAGAFAPNHFESLVLQECEKISGEYRKGELDVAEIRMIQDLIAKNVEELKKDKPNFSMLADKVLALSFIPKGLSFTEMFLAKFRVTTFLQEAYKKSVSATPSSAANITTTGVAGKAALAVHKKVENEDSNINPLTALSNVVTGDNGLFGEFGKKIFSAFSDAFREDSPEQNPANSNGSHAKPAGAKTSGATGVSAAAKKEAHPTWLDIIFSIQSFIMKIAQAFVNVKAAFAGIETKAARKTNPAADLTELELRERPKLATIFAEFVQCLPDRRKIIMNQKWFDKSISDKTVMDDLRLELATGGLEDEVASFDFYRKISQIENNDELRLHLLKQWQDEVASVAQGSDPAAIKVRDEKKKELLDEVDNSIKTQNESNLNLAARAKKIKEDADAYAQNLWNTSGGSVGAGFGGPKTVSSPAFLNQFSSMGRVAAMNKASAAHTVPAAGSERVRRSSIA
jgi:hypothetical protein